MNPANPHSDSNDGAAGNVNNQLSLWAAAGLAGMVTGMLLARAPFFEELIQQVARRAGRRRQPKPPSKERSLPMLAGAIIGSSKATIQAVLGPPRSAVVRGVGVVVHPQQVYWQSETWYYPLRRQGPMAIAINFCEGLATKVEFFTAPQA